MLAFTLFALAFKAVFAGFFVVLGAMTALALVMAFVIALLAAFIDGLLTAAHS